MFILCNTPGRFELGLMETNERLVLMEIYFWTFASL